MRSTHSHDLHTAWDGVVRRRGYCVGSSEIMRRLNCGKGGKRARKVRLLLLAGTWPAGLRRAGGSTPWWRMQRTVLTPLARFCSTSRAIQRRWSGSSALDDFSLFLRAEDWDWTSADAFSLRVQIYGRFARRNERIDGAFTTGWSAYHFEALADLLRFPPLFRLLPPRRRTSYASSTRAALPHPLL